MLQLSPALMISGHQAQRSHRQTPQATAVLCSRPAPSPPEPCGCSLTPTRRLAQRLKAARKTETVSPSSNVRSPADILAPGHPCANAALQLTQLFTSLLYSFSICRRSNRITSRPWFCQIKQAKQALYFHSNQPIFLISSTCPFLLCFPRMFPGHCSPLLYIIL